MALFPLCQPQERRERKGRRLIHHARKTESSRILRETCGKDISLSGFWYPQSASVLCARETGPSGYRDVAPQ